MLGTDRSAHAMNPISQPTILLHNSQVKNNWEITLAVEIWFLKREYLCFAANQNWYAILRRYDFLLVFIPVSLCMCFFLALASTTPANNHTGGECGFHFPSGRNKCCHCAGGSREHYSARQENHRSPWWVAVSWQLANVGILFLCSYSAPCLCFACGNKSVSLSAGLKWNAWLLWYITQSVYCFGMMWD